MEEYVNRHLSRMLGEIARGETKNGMGGVQLLMEARLKKVAMSYNIPQQEAEDAVEDTYLRMVTEIETYKRDENPSAWIFSILKSIVLTKKQRLGREISFEDAELEQRGIYSTYGDEEYIEALIDINRFFETLSERDRDLVRLHWWLGNSFAEIAKLYGKPKSTIQSQIERIESLGKKFFHVK